jgi:hypothetical protein
LVSLWKSQRLAYSLGTIGRCCISLDAGTRVHLLSLHIVLVREKLRLVRNRNTTKFHRASLQIFGNHDDAPLDPDAAQHFQNDADEEIRSVLPNAATYTPSLQTPSR